MDRKNAWDNAGAIDVTNYSGHELFRDAPLDWRGPRLRSTEFIADVRSECWGSCLAHRQ